jgi:hypothetical protein
MMAEVRKAVETKSPQALHRAAHALKGPIRNFTSQGAFRSAFQLEVMGHNGERTQIEERLATLENDLDALHVALEELQKELPSPVKP